jgi:hypothetical protein
MRKERFGQIVNRDGKRGYLQVNYGMGVVDPAFVLACRSNDVAALGVKVGEADAPMLDSH